MAVGKLLWQQILLRTQNLLFIDRVCPCQERVNMEDVIFFKKYYGNTYRVWKDSYYMIQALAPVILVAPYCVIRYNYISFFRDASCGYYRLINTTWYRYGIFTGKSVFQRGLFHRQSYAIFCINLCVAINLRWRCLMGLDFPL